MKPTVVTAGPWRAAVLLGSVQCRFEPMEWITAEDPVDQPQGASQAATVELRRSGGGIMPWALIAGEYQPGEHMSLRIAVGTSGALGAAPMHDCPGSLGRALATGLPTEFAQATLNGLVRFDPDINRSGSLTVVGAAYDEADSSEFAFEHAAALLKWVLLVHRPAESLPELDLGEFLEAWSSR